MKMTAALIVLSALALASTCHADPACLPQMQSLTFTIRVGGTDLDADHLKYRLCPLGTGIFVKADLHDSYLLQADNLDYAAAAYELWDVFKAAFPKVGWFTIDLMDLGDRKSPPRLEDVLSLDNFQFTGRKQWKDGR